MSRNEDVDNILEDAIDAIAELKDITLLNLAESIEFVTNKMLRVMVIDNDLIIKSLRMTPSHEKENHDINKKRGELYLEP